MGKCVYGGYDSRGENSVCAWRVGVVVCLVKSEKCICCRLPLALMCGKITQDYRSVVCNYNIQKEKYCPKKRRVSF